MWLFKNKKRAVYPAKGSSSTYTIRCVCQVG